jgi:hypothetical protein
VCAPFGDGQDAKATVAADLVERVRKPRYSESEATIDICWILERSAGRDVEAGGAGLGAGRAARGHEPGRAAEPKACAAS